MINQRTISTSELPNAHRIGSRSISIDGLTKRTLAGGNDLNFPANYAKKKSLAYLSNESEKSPRLSQSAEEEDIVFKNLIDDKIYKLKVKFWWFAWVASLNHALNYVVTSYASSLLNGTLGSIILGLTWTLNAVSGLTVATPIVRTLGFKTSMIISLWGYAIQISTLYWALVADDAVTAWTVAIVGSSIAGITSAVWWTSQGSFLSLISG
jgi:hypothetical protein